MSDAANLLDQIEQDQAEKETAINELFAAVSPAAFGGQRTPTTIGLTWGYYGGRWNGTPIPHGVVELPPSSTSHIVVDRATGEIILDTPSDDFWNLPDDYGRLYAVTTSTVEITSWEDHRIGSGGVIGGGGSSSSAVLADGDYGDVVVSGTGTVLTIDPTVLSAAARGLLNDADAATMRATLQLVPGTDVQAYDPDLAALAAIGAATQGDILYFNGTAWARLGAGTAKQVLQTGGAGANPSWANRLQTIQIACSDETTALATGTAKVTFRMPYAFTLTDVRASLTTAQTSGSIFTVDVNESGTTVISTKLTIDNTEKTSVTAATPRVISDASLADDAEITIDIDQIGDGTAKGLKVSLIGYPT
jgi:hypothetical protein